MQIFCGPFLWETPAKIPVKVFTHKADFLTEEGINGFADFIRERGFVPAHILHAPAFPVQNEKITELDDEHEICSWSFLGSR